MSQGSSPDAPQVGEPKKANPFEAPLPSVEPKSAPLGPGSVSPTSPKVDPGEWDYASKPWERLWAGFFDLTIAVVPMVILLAVLQAAIPDFKISKEAAPLADWFLRTLLVWPFMGAACIALMGTTPGKAIFGIRVRTQEGKKPTFSQALGRCYSTLVSGTWLGIPILYLIPANTFIKELGKGNKATWDNETIALHRPSPRSKYVRMWVVAIFTLSLNKIIGILGNQ